MEKDQKTKAAISTAQLSAPDFDFDAEFFFSDYNACSNADLERQDGIDTFRDKDIVIKSLTFDELAYLLNSKGTYLLFFGGSWCHHTRAAIAYVNDLAKAHGIKAVYNFDFRMDGATRDTDIKTDISDTEWTGSRYNYLYGELVDRYLSNLNDWTAHKDSITWRDADNNERKCGDLQVPFLCLYNKENTVRNYLDADGSVKQGGAGEGRTYPIVYAFEKCVDRDSTGIYDGVSDGGGRHYVTDAYLAQLGKVFDYIDANGIAVDTYTNDEYFYEAYIEGNGRGHAPKLFDVFDKGEKIGIDMINFRQLNWLLRHDGNALILFGGAWCANTCAGVGPINKYAVANNVTLYMFDFRLDGKHPIDFWGYWRDRQFVCKATFTPRRDVRITPDWNVTPDTDRKELNPYAQLFVDMANAYLPNLESHVIKDSVVSYIDADGKIVSAQNIDVPYLFAYNKDFKDENGVPKPIIRFLEHPLEITESGIARGIYMYRKDNYTAYNKEIYEVFQAYAGMTGIEPKEYTGAPHRPLVDAEESPDAAGDGGCDCCG